MFKKIMVVGLLLMNVDELFASSRLSINAIKDQWDAARTFSEDKQKGGMNYDWDGSERRRKCIMLHIAALENILHQAGRESSFQRINKQPIFTDETVCGIQWFLGIVNFFPCGCTKNFAANIRLGVAIDSVEDLIIKPLNNIDR